MPTKILIIDDDVEALDNVDQMLQLQNFKTLTATDGATGMQLAQDYQPDLILCDVVLPKLDGLSLLSELRKQEATSTIPFILLSARAARSDIYSGMALGADHYLTKPITKKDLLKAIQTCLDKYNRLAQKAIAQERKIQALEEQLQRSQELTEVHLSMLKKFAHELRHPISNISMAIQLFSMAEHEVPGDLLLLEDECIRAISLLNEVSNLQELLQSSKVNVLRRLLALDEAK